MFLHTLNCRNKISILKHLFCKLHSKYTDDFNQTWCYLRYDLRHFSSILQFVKYSKHLISFPHNKILFKIFSGQFFFLDWFFFLLNWTIKLNYDTLIALFHCKCSLYLNVLFKFNFLKIYLQYQMNGIYIYIAGCYGYAIIIITIIMTFAYLSYIIYSREQFIKVDDVRILRAHFFDRSGQFCK